MASRLTEPDVSLSDISPSLLSEQELSDSAPMSVSLLLFSLLLLLGVLTPMPRMLLLLDFFSPFLGVVEPLAGTVSVLAVWLLRLSAGTAATALAMPCEISFLNMGGRRLLLLLFFGDSAGIVVATLATNASMHDLMSSLNCCAASGRVSFALGAQETSKRSSLCAVQKSRTCEVVNAELISDLFASSTAGRLANDCCFFTASTVAMILSTEEGSDTSYMKMKPLTLLHDALSMNLPATWGSRRSNLQRRPPILSFTSVGLLGATASLPPSFSFSPVESALASACLPTSASPITFSEM
mmetsp:Transcript_7946/g.33430  ORF Transcript_7946/g.33430 Transcript_7946/m.33430 type:complete len:298 (-) Transcript_7946:79-972(-)